jgi:hypothetical protein
MLLPPDQPEANNEHEDEVARAQPYDKAGMGSEPQAESGSRHEEDQQRQEQEEVTWACKHARDQQEA